MSFSGRLVVGFAALGLLGAGGLVWLWLYGFPALGLEGIYSNERQRAVLATELVADKERDALSNWVINRRRELKLLASSEAVVRGMERTNTQHSEEDRAMLSRQLSSVVSANPSTYGYLYLANADKKMVAVADTYSNTFVLPKHDPLFEESQSPGMFELVNIGTRFGSPSLMIGNQVLGIDSGGMPDGRMLGVLLADIDLFSSFEGSQTNLYQSLDETAVMLLVDWEGRALIASDKTTPLSQFAYVGSAATPGSEGVKTLVNEQGQEVIAVYRHLHLGASAGLSLVVIRDANAAMSAAQGHLNRVISFGCGVFLMLMAIVLFAARRLTRAENNIRQLNADLEQRVIVRTEELAEANLELQDALRKLEGAKDELVQSEKLSALGALVAGVAHELNTPIGNALLVSTSLTDDVNDFKQQVEKGLTRSMLTGFIGKTSQGASLMTSNLRRSAELISSFKQISMDQTSEKRRTFQLDVLVDEVVQVMLPSLRLTPHRLIAEMPKNIQFDSFPGPLSRVLINLVNNAISHAFTPHSPGLMQIKAAALDETHVQIIFSDDGAGMSPETLRRVFDPFFTTKLGEGGSGLGMNIVYNTVSQLLGGKIDVQSTLGAGTQWRIVIPKVAPSSEE